MLSPVRSRAAFRLGIWFALLAGVPLTALGWLGWRLLVQERSLDAQRLREQLDTTTALVARDLDRGLTGWEERLASTADGQPVALPPGTVWLALDAGGLVRRAGAQLPFYPRIPASSRPSPGTFAKGEALGIRPA